MKSVSGWLAGSDTAACATAWFEQYQDTNLKSSNQRKM